MSINCKNNVQFSTPIQSVNISRTSMGKNTFQKAVSYLNAGDIFVLNNTRHGYFDDGLYIVRERDSADGLKLTKINENTKNIQHNKNIATHYTVDGDVTVIGHLNVCA